MSFGTHYCSMFLVSRVVVQSRSFSRIVFIRVTLGRNVVCFSIGNIVCMSFSIRFSRV